VADEALTWIQQRVDRHTPEKFFPRPVDRTALLAFLKPRAGLYARLSEMHDCGLLGRMFPEFQAIFCRVVRDFYHKYTVDEHTLLTIRNLERLATGAVKGRERFGGLVADLTHPEQLVLSLLFHESANGAMTTTPRKASAWRWR
jgi:[protein-PII] uridylyltransferase